MENIEILKDKEKILQKELNYIKEQIEDYELLQLREKYSKDFCCDKCKFSAVFDFSHDGEHNKCALAAAPCTCCHDGCERYQPDNEMTLWIKENMHGSISQNTYEALDHLGLYIFHEKYLNDVAMQLIKTLLKKEWK